MIQRCLLALFGATSVVIGQPAFAQMFQTYHCRDGSEFVAAFFSGDRTAYLQLDGQQLALPHRPSLSGSRYAKGDIALRVTKTVTTLKRGRRSTECSAL